MSQSIERAERVNVPFLDMRPMHDPLRDGIVADLATVIDANAFINGPQVAAFEEAFADVLRRAALRRRRERPRRAPARAPRRWSSSRATR